MTYEKYKKRTEKKKKNRCYSEGQDICQPGEIIGYFITKKKEELKKIGITTNLFYNT